MITLKYLILYVTFMSVCVNCSASYYDAAESEIFIKDDEEQITTSASKKCEDDYQNGDVTTVDDELITATEDITTSMADLITDTDTTTSENLTDATDTNVTSTTVKNGSTVKRFVYRQKNVIANGTIKKPEVQLGKVYAILESLINEPDSKKEKEDGDFEDTSEEIATALYYEVTTNTVDDIKIVKYGDAKPVDFNRNIKYKGRNPLCPHFIESASFQMDKMANVWLPVYSDLQDRLPCFKILIRKTLAEEREQYEQWYGNFNESMNWNECYFEIKSAAVKYRKHFLQGGVAEKGVMRNILLVQNEKGDYDFAEENSDQWIFVKNLLLLHDCQSGETIVFARVPSRPYEGVITDALQELGLKMTGEMLSCYA